MKRTVKQPSWKALAEKVGVSHQWIIRHKAKPGSPGESRAVAKWKAYAAQVEAMRRSGRNLKVDTKAKPEESTVAVAGKRYTADDILQLKARLTEAQATTEEIKSKVQLLQLEREEKQLVPVDDAKEAIAAVLVPLRRSLDSMPRTIANRANPVDPQLAEQVIREHIDYIFRGIKEATI